VSPEGAVPVVSFLKNHHNAQFASLADITALDVPTRQYRFEVLGSLKEALTSKHKNID